MKLKRRLDTVHAIAFKFFKTDEGRAFTFSIQIPGMDSCDYRWEWADPKIAAARHAAWERAEAAKSPAQRAAEHRAAARASKCRDSCGELHLRRLAVRRRVRPPVAHTYASAITTW